MICIKQTRPSQNGVYIYSHQEPSVDRWQAGSIFLMQYLNERFKSYKLSIKTTCWVHEYNGYSEAFKLVPA